jgi:hypothetical protein
MIYADPARCSYCGAERPANATGASAPRSPRKKDLEEATLNSFPLQANTGLMTLPATSVRRNRRPLYRYVSRV